MLQAITPSLLRWCSLSGSTYGWYVAILRERSCRSYPRPRRRDTVIRTPVWDVRAPIGGWNQVEEYYTPYPDMSQVRPLLAEGLEEHVLASLHVSGPSREQQHMTALSPSPMNDCAARRTALIGVAARHAVPLSQMPLVEGGTKPQGPPSQEPWLLNPPEGFEPSGGLNAALQKPRTPSRTRGGSKLHVYLVGGLALGLVEGAALTECTEAPKVGENVWHTPPGLSKPSPYGHQTGPATQVAQLARALGSPQTAPLLRV